ncbi:hypothetical protein E2C06_18325 [Dankookia rubra]|uniref:Uncharacterized protein n=1 Tax=Dankookia rubra TaxID=1442381 RepID=A0A4V3A9Z8_9PROT|nr:hypothetical protein E2C06_18325 [Dankookia rubra]
MPTDSKTGLFGTLPKQMAAARPVGVPRLRQAERRQVSLRPISLEDLLPPNHRARFVWAFAERLDLTALYHAIKAVEGHPGHPAAVLLQGSQRAVKAPAGLSGSLCLGRYDVAEGAIACRDANSLPSRMSC